MFLVGPSGIPLLAEEGWREAPGWSVRRNRVNAGLTTPSAPLRWLRIIFLVAQPPLLCEEGNALNTILPLQMMIEVEQARPIINLTWRRFLQQFRRRFDHVWKICPRFGKNAGIVDGYLINEVIVGRQPQPLDDVQLAGMKVAVLTEPGILDEIRRIDD